MEKGNKAPASTTERGAEQIDSYTYLAKKMTGLAQSYKDLPTEDVYRAFLGAGGVNIMLGMPDVQNRRVRSINTRPANYSKDEIEKMVSAPETNEKALREISASLSWSTRTFDLIQQTYTDMLSYYWYITTEYSFRRLSREQKKRDYAMAYRVAKAMDIQAKAHEMAGLVMRYGKVFYTARISVDKSHGKVNYAFLQQLPEDYCKIVGFNNGPGKYTVAFNLMYFAQPGNDWRQFGDLFQPYMAALGEVVEESKGRYVYSSATEGKARGSAVINTEKFKRLEISRTAGHPKWEMIGGEWLYWVTLPADAVFVAEIDDRSAVAAPPTTGLMVSMTQIPNYEAAQMEIVLNPLTSVLTGSLETSDTKGMSPNADPIRVSPTVRKLFETLWYRMLSENNTSGIGLFLAPANDLKLQTISDTVSNTNIASMALSDQILKSGLSSVIPTTNDPKVGVAQLAAKVQANYMRPVYWAVERLMNWVFESLRFETPMAFHMFGTVFDREAELESARKGMTLGILHDTLKYDAMVGITPLEDMAVSEFISESGLLDRRIPLVSSYSAKQGESRLPPRAKQEMDPGGRPAEDGSINSEVTEKLNSILKRLAELE